MEFWLERGCDGFRVDMAGSLVKHDTPDCSYTQAIYQEIREKLDAQFPGGRSGLRMGPALSGAELWL